MKNTLGKILLLIIFEIFALANTNLATYSLSTNKKDVSFKEAVEITFQAQQKNHSDVMYFFLEVQSSKDYKVELLQKHEEEISYHNKKTTFTYLLFPLKSGEIKINFDFTIKQASDEAVAQVYRGGRNNVRWIDTINTKIELEPVVLHVQELDINTDLVGDFKIVSKIKEERIKAYESVNITYYLQGTGYDEVTIKPIDEIDGVKIFSAETKHFNKATKDGYQIQREFDYALIADKDFSIEEKEIKCYSTKSHSYYTLKTKPYNIKVDKLDKSTLIDNENYPDETYNFENIKQFFIYMLIFITGFMSAKLLPTSFKRISKKEKFSDIKETKTPKELLLLLMNDYRSYKLDSTYADLETLLYKDKSEKSFKTIKKELFEALK